MWRVSRFFENIASKCEERRITSNFDSYNSESRALTSLRGCSGVRTEISKAIYSFFQITGISIFDRDISTNQLFFALNRRNIMLQLGVDNESSFQLRASHKSGGVLSKIHTIISSRRDLFSQLELEVRGRVISLGLKLISPAITSAGIICVANLLRQVGSLSIGVEAIGVENSLGISVCGRRELENGIFAIGLQQFTALSLSYYHRLDKFFDFGTELQVSRSYPASIAIGCRVLTPRAEVKICANSDMSLVFSLDEKLTENLAFSINAEMRETGCIHGFGVSFEF